MDLTLIADEVEITANDRRYSQTVKVQLIGVDEKEVIETVISEISIDDFVAIKGSQSIYDFLALHHPELFEKEKE